MKPKETPRTKPVRRVSESEQQWEWLGFDPADVLDDSDIDLIGCLMRNRKRRSNA